MKNKLALTLKLWAGAGICLGLVWLAGCKGAQIASGPETAKPPETKPAPAAAQPEEETAGKEKKLGWSYDPTGKRDPFKTYEVQPSETVNPLITYNLDQMYIDGIIVGAGRDVAHVLIPDGSDWFVKVGDEMGVNRGRVKQILPDGIVIEEQYLDPVDPQKIRVVEKFLKMEAVSTNIPIHKK